MRFELNQKQKDYLLKEFFTRYDVYKAFDVDDIEYVASRRLEASTDVEDLRLKGWPTIFMDGMPVTCVNAPGNMGKWRRLLELGE